MKKIRLLLALAGLFASSCGDSRGPESAVLFVQTSDGAMLTDAALTLTGVNEQTGWFTDRPERESGQIPTGEFLTFWDEGENSFAENPPNADFTCRVNRATMNYFLELTNPRLDGDSLTYGVRAMGETAPLAASTTCSGPAHLFIDSAVETALGPTTATVSIGVLSIDVESSLVLFDELMLNYGDLLPTTIALPVASGEIVGECGDGQCAAEVAKLRGKGVQFAFADTQVMPPSGPDLNGLSGALRASAQAYGLELADVQAYILQGSASHLANYAALKQNLGIKLGYFNESTKFNPQGPIWEVCDPAWVIAAIYTDGFGKPLVDGDKKSDCYCNADATAVAVSMQFNYEKQCGGNDHCMPLAISFEDCNDRYLYPLLGYSGDGASPLSSSPSKLRAFLTASEEASNAPIVYYRLEFALLRINGTKRQPETGCAPIITCENLADTCPIPARRG